MVSVQVNIWPPVAFFVVFIITSTVVVVVNWSQILLHAKVSLIMTYYLIAACAARFALISHGDSM